MQDQRPSRPGPQLRGFQRLAWSQPQYQGPALCPQYWGQQPVYLLPIKATFDGDPEKLPFFLNQVWAHLNRYTPAYTDNSMMMDAGAVNLEVEAAEWVTSLHDEQAPELWDTNLFMDQLRAWFEDES